MAKVLVADDERNVRLSLVYILCDSGHDVIEAQDGFAAVQQAVQQQPDLILLDVMMPGIDGFEVLRQLRENPATENIPVILLTALPPSEGEQDGMKLGVTHYISKPWNPEAVELIVRVALRGGESANGQHERASSVWAGSTSHRALSMDRGDGDSGASKFLPLGEPLSLLQKKLGGGIATGSLVLMEGATSAGTSVLGQHIVHGALEGGWRVTYFTSNHTTISLAKQMGSIGLGISKYLEDDRLSIYPLQEPVSDEDCGPMLEALALDIERLPKEHQLIIVDAITNLAGYSQDQSVLGFFSACRRACSKGRTVVVVAHTYSLNETMMYRLSAVSDAHLKLRVGKVRDKVVRMLEVVKANSVELNRDNTVSFEVEPGSGIRIIPFSRATV